jgi:hypothetical protein
MRHNVALLDGTDDREKAAEPLLLVVDENVTL